MSGEPFDAYVEQHIFAPLGMKHSTFRQPLPANLKPLHGGGLHAGQGQARRYEYRRAPRRPAALAASGDDMGRFMIAHLQNGKYNGQQILKPETAQLMHSRAEHAVPGPATGWRSASTRPTSTASG